MKKIIFVILFLFFVGYTGAFELGISPIQINFEGRVNKEICHNISVFSKDYTGIIVAEDKWASEGILVRDLRIHNLSSSSLGIELNYPMSFKLDGAKKVNVCLIGRNRGVFHGLLLFKTGRGNVGVGSWMVVNISGKGERLDKGGDGILSGNDVQLSIANILPKNVNNMLLVQLSANSILLVVFLVLLVRINGRKRGVE